MSFCLFSFWFFFRHFFLAFQLLSTPKCLFDLLNVSSIETSPLGFAIYCSMLLILSFSFFTFRHVLLFIFLSILFWTFLPCIPTVINAPIEISSLLVAYFFPCCLLLLFLPFFFFFSSLSFSSCPFIYFPFGLFSSVLLSFPCFLNFFFWFSVWTSVLSFCLIILVFARMSLRVNYTARRFLMIIHACWVSVSGWGRRRSRSSIKTYYSNPHYLITLKNSWSLFLENFLINPTSLLIFLIA